MTSIDTFLADLNRLSVQLWVDGDRLRCSAPKGTLTPAIQEQLQTYKADILTLLQQSNRFSNRVSDSIPTGLRSQPLPLSFAQQRLWFFDQLQPGNAVYNIPFAVQLTGDLKLGVLAQTLTALVQRHESLRTTFKTVDNQPVQVIASATAITVPLMDLQALPTDIQAQEVSRLATEEAQQPFRLTDVPLWRVKVMRLSATNHIVLFTLHHIVSDAWSIGVFIRELVALYSAFLMEKPAPLSPLPIQYTDFAIWQRQWLQGTVLETQRSYWQQQLAGTLPVLQLPTDRPRPAVQTFRGATQSFTVSLDVTQALKTFSQQEKATLFMTLLAAFKTWLWRYTGQTDLLVGSPIANRPRSELEGLIGFFVNTLVLRTNLSGNPRFRDLVQQVREVTLDAFAHQDLPFELLVEQLPTERSLSYPPLFQVMFVLQNAPTEALQLPGLSLSPVPQENQTTKFDLTLAITETASGLKGSVEYSTDLFDATTIARMVKHFCILLTGIVNQPDQRLSDLPLLTPTEQQKVLVDWNQSQAAYDAEKCWHELVEAQVDRTPNAIALLWENEQLTYAELNRRSNQLAHYLIKLGVQPEVKVGICVERSPAMIIALLGVLKAGGAYIPLDPTYPTERLAFMLADSQVMVLLTQANLVAKLPRSQAAIVCLDRDWQQIAQGNSCNPVTPVSLDNLAYLIYTSGSTGTPKGVLVPHAGLSNLTAAKIRACNVSATSRVLQFFSVSFDASIPEIVMALGAGATLCLSTSESLQPGAAIVQLLQKQTITHITLTPSALAALPIIESLPALQMVLVGGEACAPELITQWSQGRLFINAYGPTEVTVNASMVPCGNGEPLLPTVRPSANKQLYVLDHYLQPVPIGVPGELYIGGVGLARGYFHHPAKTAETFIPNPFSDRPGSRLYKTGDCVCYQPNGSITFLGRMDHQVKIRGFRIEPGEIETLLNQHPAVVTSVVMAREDQISNRRLVAYIVAAVDQRPTMSELRRFLKQQVPDYMVPAAFVLLDRLPLSPNGKVDRQSLPAPDAARPDIAATFVAPRNPIEVQLVEIWCQILKLDKIGIQDDFFELGGHSLLIVQLLARMRTVFHVDLPLQSLFEEPTIAGLADRIAIANRDEISPSSEVVLDLSADTVLDPAIHPAHTTRPLFTEPNTILLTGATGFLGAFLLDELLRQTKATIYCLVRAADQETGQQKLQASSAMYGLDGDRLPDRIIPVIGDLAQPLLGLTEAQFQDLAKQIDVIYHNGAQVNHTAPYASLKAANVSGTQDVLRLACHTNVKPVHFISTISVFSAVSASGTTIIREQDALGNRSPMDGYTQSKWVAEKLVAIARDRGLPVTIYRPGRISGHSQTGVFNANDFLAKLIIGCIQLGSAAMGEMTLDILPVDYVSQAIVQLSRQPESLGKAFHLVHPQPVSSQILIAKIRSLGFSLQQIPYDHWRSQLLQIAERSPDHPLYPLIPLFPAKNSQASTSSPPLQFDCQNTLAGLAETSITCPPINDALLDTYFTYLICNGFLTQPQPTHA